MPKDSRHFAKCQNTQFVCNTYTFLSTANQPCSLNKTRSALLRCLNGVVYLEKIPRIKSSFTQDIHCVYGKGSVLFPGVL